MSVSIITAVAENWIIGKNNELPWNLPADLKHFAEITKGKTVLMGLKTYNSIIARLGHALPGRKNIILTSQKNPAIKEEQITSFDEALALAKAQEIFIIGGASVYRAALPFADKLYLTRVHANVEGDVSFPDINWAEWNLVNSEVHKADEKNQYDFTFQIYERKK